MAHSWAVLPSGCGTALVPNWDLGKMEIECQDKGMAPHWQRAGLGGVWEGIPGCGTCPCPWLERD